MSEKLFVPEQFSHLVDLASVTTGGFVLYATDDYFAEKENLLKADNPVWIEGKYTDKGKWMDGWESQRRRTAGHDWAVIRLGLPGQLEGVLVDTTHFKGNAPQEVSIDGLEADPYLPVQKVLEHPGWAEILPRTAVKPDFPNVLSCVTNKRITHVRLHQYPDGGVARLRVYGKVLTEQRMYWRRGSIDLGAVENGGTVAAVSDQFFGPPSNLLLPGRGVNMGDGWETKRRRTPGSDWCVIKLGRRAILDRIQLDTHFFKGNAPQHVLVEALDEKLIGEEKLQQLLRAPDGWLPLIDKHPLEQHKRHELDPVKRVPVTHVRVHIFPHGGVNRMRFYGQALDTDIEQNIVSQLNAKPESETKQLFLSFCGSTKFADKMNSARPFRSVRSLFGVAEDVYWSMAEEDYLEAFRAHPKLGEKKAAQTQTEQSAKWSSGEQSGTASASSGALDELAARNEEYWQKFGFIFICFATGKTADDMLEHIKARLLNDRATEIENATTEQWKITKLRLEKWLKSEGA